MFGNNNNGGIMGGGIMGGGAPTQGGMPGFIGGGAPAGGIMGNAPIPSNIPQPMQPSMPMQQPQIAGAQLGDILGLSKMTAQPGIMDQVGGVELGATTIMIRSIALGATRPQANQFRRGYDVTVSNQGIQAICNKIMAKGENRITALDMATMFNDPTVAGRGVVQYSGTPEGAANIENGWDMNRYRFVIVADIFRAGRHVTTEIVSGYTDHSGINNAHMPNSMSIDPNMVFVVNNVASASIQHTQMSAGHRAVANMRHSNAVLRNTAWTGVAGQNQMYMTRPTDVAHTYSKLPLFQGLAERGNGFGDPFMTSGAGSALLDMDSTLAGTAKMAKTASNLPSTFSARLVTGLIQQELPAGDPMNMEGDNAGAVAAAAMTESNFSAQKFIHAINAITQNGVLSNASFTYSDLMRLDPTADDRCQVYTQARELNTSAIYVPDGNSASNIAEATPEGIAATSIAQGLVGMMLGGGVSLICITATNAGGQTVVVPTAFDGMDTDGMLANRVHNLCTRMHLEVFNVISTCDQGDMFHCEIIADAFNDLYISISLNGAFPTPFVYPAFASSGSSPMMTTQQSKSHALATGINQVIETIKGAMNEKANQQRPSFGGGIGSY